MSKPKGKYANTSKQYKGYEYTGAQIQNTKKSRVYVFGKDETCDDDVVEYEMSAVRSRKAPSQELQPDDDQPTYFEREITEGDTLRSICLQYGCQVAEIKRINNMIQDQDFYAFTKIKVPLKKYSFLTETVNKPNGQQASSQHSTWNGTTIVDETVDSTDHESVFQDTDTDCNMSDPETQRLLIKKTLSIKQNTNSQSKEAKRFLRKMDKDLTKICQSARSNRNSLNEVVSVLTDRTIQPLRRKQTGYFNLNGADCGIRWWSIATLVLVSVIIAPLILLFYFWYKGQLFTNSTSGSN